MGGWSGQSMSQSPDMGSEPMKLRFASHRAWEAGRERERENENERERIRMKAVCVVVVVVVGQYAYTSAERRQTIYSGYRPEAHELTPD